MNIENVDVKLKNGVLKNFMKKLKKNKTKSIPITLE